MTSHSSAIRKSGDAPCTCSLLNYSLDRYRKGNNVTVVAASPRLLWRWAEAHLKVSQGTLRSLPVCTSGVASTSRSWLRGRPLGWLKMAHAFVGDSALVAHLALLKAQSRRAHSPRSAVWAAGEPHGAPCTAQPEVGDLAALATFRHVEKRRLGRIAARCLGLPRLEPPRI